MLEGWAVLRQRTDKKANAIKTAESILKTIRDPVEQDSLHALLEQMQDATFGQDKAGGILGKRNRGDADISGAEDLNECF